MKCFSTLLLSLALFFTAYSTETPPIENRCKKMEFGFMANYGDIVTVVLNEKENVLSFSTIDQMTFLQILDEQGRLEFQLPVMSNDVLIDLDDFEIGKFQINLIIDNNEMISSTFKK